MHVVHMPSEIKRRNVRSTFPDRPRKMERKKKPGMEKRETGVDDKTKRWGRGRRNVKRIGNNSSLSVLLLFYFSSSSSYFSFDVRILYLLGGKRPECQISFEFRQRRGICVIPLILMEWELTQLGPAKCFFPPLCPTLHEKAENESGMV